MQDLEYYLKDYQDTQDKGSKGDWAKMIRERTAERFTYRAW